MTRNVTKQGLSPTPWNRENWRSLAGAGYLQERITVFKTNMHYLSMCSFCLVYLVPGAMDAALVVDISRLKWVRETWGLSYS